MWKQLIQRTCGLSLPFRPGVAVLLGGLLAGLPSQTSAQEYPARLIKALTNVSVGGTFDIFIRALGDELHRRWGQPVIIEPRPGGNFIIAGRACGEAPADGYTICALSGETLVYSEFLSKNVPYNPVKDFTPITNMFFNTQVLVVNASLGVKTLQELAELARAKPKTLAYLAPAVPQRLFMERFIARQGIDIVNVPFRGGGEALTSILTGATPIAFFGGANFLPYVRDGKMNALAVDSGTRSPLYPDTPTLAELGYGDKLTRNYFGLVAPAGTPPAIIDRLYNQIVAIISEPSFRQQHLIERGLEPIANTPAEFTQFLREDRIAFEQIAREAGLQPQ